MTRPSDMPPAQRFAHGTRARYTSGCRCSGCRQANTAYARQRAKTIIFRGRNSLVPAENARLHMEMLSRRGVGRRAVGAASDVGVTTLAQIRTGAKTMIRRYTEQRILAVTADAASDRALIPAKQTWSQLRTLVREGFSEAKIARRLGYTKPALQFNQKRVTAKNAARVDRLFRMVMAGGEP